MGTLIPYQPSLCPCCCEGVRDSLPELALIRSRTAQHAPSLVASIDSINGLAPVRADWHAVPVLETGLHLAGSPRLTKACRDVRAPVCRKDIKRCAVRYNGCRGRLAICWKLVTLTAIQDEWVAMYKGLSLAMLDTRGPLAWHQPARLDARETWGTRPVDASPLYIHAAHWGMLGSIGPTADNHHVLHQILQSAADTFHHMCPLYMAG